ncbi:MAG: di-heme oxidoredictase family protein [Planctomycetota bacterium]
MKTLLVSSSLLLALFLFASHDGTVKSASLDESTPVPAVGTFGGPSRQLTTSELTSWINGRRLFDKDFRFSEGLGGPEYNGDSCRACHEDPVIGGAGGLELNVSRFAFDNGGSGPYMDLPGGQAASKFRRLDAAALSVGPREEIDPTADVFEQRQTPALFGFGEIDLISDATILSNEDPGDANSDGVMGVARMIMVAGVQEVGRFGWKGQVPRLADFVRDAMGGEMGITVPNNGRGFGSLSDNDPAADPEISDADLDDIAFFLSHLAAPPRGGSTAPEVAQGEVLFTQVGCATCHIPTLMGPSGPVTLYSNLLLHHIFAPTFRGMSEPGAPVGFYKTPVLIGISRSAPYLHDGRAETLQAAIEAHLGEASNAQAAFFNLTATEQAALITFLEDL